MTNYTNVKKNKKKQKKQTTQHIKLQKKGGKQLPMDN